MGGVAHPVLDSIKFCGGVRPVMSGGGRGSMPPFRLSYPCGGSIISVLVVFYKGCLVLFLLWCICLL